MLNDLDSFFAAVFAGDEQAIILLVVIYAALVGLVGLAVCLRIRSWPAASGVLLSSGLETWGAAQRSDEQDYEAVVRYRYSVDGEAFEGKRLSPTYMIASSNLRFLLNWQMSGITRRGADKVDVFYNPAKPEKSFLIKPGIIMLCFLAAITLISTIFLIMSI